MDLKLFGDTQKIDWEALGVSMPFAPMHELAEKYTLEPHTTHPLHSPQNKCKIEDFKRTFEIREKCTHVSHSNVTQRIYYRVRNTISALDQCTPDTICINLGGGMHHAGKYPKDGYAYSLINDIIWAVDYQLETHPTSKICIIDLDFHFGGGTWEYYPQASNIWLWDAFHPQGILYKHTHLIPTYSGVPTLESIALIPAADKILLNIGTDWYQDDALFGQYGQMLACDLLDVWWNTVRQITIRKIPLCITMGGGYGSAGLRLYEEFINGLRLL